MRTNKTLMLVVLAVILTFVASLAFASGGGVKKAHEKIIIEGGEHVTIAGTIIDSHKEPVGEAVVEIEMAGKPILEVETAGNGHYLAEFMVEAGAMGHAEFEMKVHKTSFEGKTVHMPGHEFAQKGNHYYDTEEVMLVRHLGSAYWIATIVFPFSELRAPAI